MVPKLKLNAAGATDVERQVQQVLATEIDVVRLRHRFALIRAGKGQVARKNTRVELVSK